MTEIMFSQLAKLGYKASIVSVGHLGDLEQEIENYYEKGFFDEEFYKERLSRFVFRPPDSLLRARSVIIIAVPQPQIQVIFTCKGEKVPCMIPPTYVASTETDRQLENLLTGILGPENYRVAQALLPEKLLAVHSGLGSYGRNNICYVGGMGSFHQLVAFYTDFSSREDSWQESKLMKSCEKCSACLRSCPTGAITPKRFLLHAERCISFHNERIGDFPGWIDPSWHNCVVGCLLCQTVCPENKDFLQWVEEKEEFSQKETDLLLEGKQLDQLPSSVIRKLERLELIEYLNVLPRNLSVLLNREPCP
ncbi:MAG: 4Fe-4S double cluster binding domain-containing protein [Candidatus Aerophobetes bacterium]